MDRHEFAIQYQAIYPQLWLIAASIVGDRTEAEDIVQEAAVIAFRKRDTFEPGTSFRAWATRIVRFCASNSRRKSLSRRTHATDPSFLDEHSGQSPVHVDLDDEMLLALNQLTPDARACLLLRVVEERSYEEIAEMLGIPQGTAMSHVHRSRHKMRRGLSAPRGGADD